MEIDKYEQRAKQKLNEKTLTSRVSALRSLEPFVSGSRPTTEEVEDWAGHMIEQFDDGEMSSGSISQYFKSVTYYYETMGMDAESIEHIGDWLPKPQSDPGDYLTQAELEEMRDSIRTLRDRAIIELMYFYGRRPGEIRLLNTEDIVWPQDTEPDVPSSQYSDEPTVTFTILKKTDASLSDLVLHNGGGTDETFRYRKGVYTYKDEPFEHVLQYLPYREECEQEITLGGTQKTVHPLFTTSHGRISQDTIERCIDSAAERAGIDKNVTPKSMRHSRATHLYRDGVGKDEIAARQLAHSPESDVVGRYLHEREEDTVRDPLELDSEDE